MIKRWFLALGFLMIAGQGFAFPCYFTLAKDNCWTDYEVNLTLSDADTNQVITTFTVAKGESWKRQPFSCQPGQRLTYQATFNPVFWQGDQGKIYPAQRFLSLPAAIGKDQSGWDIPICFPAAFSEVPFPPKAAGNCRCDFSAIQPIPPKIEK